MNNIISKIAASALLATVAISGVSAKSTLTMSQDINVSLAESNASTQNDFAIDIKGSVVTDINLTFVPNINATPGSGFTLKFENGGYVEVPSIFLCVDSDANKSNGASGLTVVGNMFSKGTVVDGIMTAPRFQFKNDANETLIQNQSYVLFRTDSACSKEPEILGLNGACQTVTAQVVDGITTQSTAFPDYDTNKRKLGTTKRMIRISCETPVCKIDASKDMKQFTTNPVVAGINGGVVGVSDVGINATLTDCPECDQTSACLTTIEIENNSTVALQQMKFALNFMNKKGENANTNLKLKDVKITVVKSGVDQNKTVGYTIDGSTVTLTGLDAIVATGGQSGVTNDNSAPTHIAIEYTPTGTDAIIEGKVSGRIYDLDTNISKAGIDVIYDKTQDFASFEVAGLTVFTVPYMNTNYKTFVKITTKSETPAKLSAVITDQDGKTADVALADIDAKGTVYLFSNKGPLFDAAKAAGLKNAWTVDFTTSAAAVVDAYMTTATGERRVAPYLKAD
jgi:hypothetical protein